MAAIQDNQTVAGPDPEQGSQSPCNSCSSSVMDHDIGTSSQQELGTGQKAEQAIPTQGSQLFTAAHADDTIGAPALFSSSTEVTPRGVKRGCSASPRQGSSTKTRRRSPIDPSLSSAVPAPLVAGTSLEEDLALRIIKDYPGNWQHRRIGDAPAGKVYHHRLKEQTPPQRVVYHSFPIGMNLVMYITDVYTLGGEVLFIFVDGLKGLGKMGSPGQPGFRVKRKTTKICFAHPGDVAAKCENFLPLILRDRRVVPLSQEIPQAMQQREATQQQHAQHPQYHGLSQESGPTAPTTTVFQSEKTIFNHSYAIPVADMGVGQHGEAQTSQPGLYAQDTGFQQDLPFQAYGQSAQMAPPQQHFPPVQYGMGAPEMSMPLHPMTGQDTNARFPTHSQFDSEAQSLDHDLFSLHEDDSMFETNQEAVANTGDASASMGMNQSMQQYSPTPLQRNDSVLGRMPHQPQDGFDMNLGAASSTGEGQLLGNHEDLTNSSDPFGLAAFSANGELVMPGNNGSTETLWRPQRYVYPTQDGEELAEPEAED